MVCRCDGSATKRDILWYLKQRTDIKKEDLHQILEKIAQANPDSFDTQAYYANVLLDEKKYDDIISVMRAWLKTHDSSYGFDYLHAKRRTAQALRLKGDAAAAWTEIEPIVSSYQGAVLSEAAYIKDAIGDREGALKLARAEAERYPQEADSRITLSRLMWRHGDIPGGMRELQSGYPIPYWDWCHVVGKRFSMCSW
jgi:tetratricopeptide (TPR) repeat protein